MSIAKKVKRGEKVFQERSVTTRKIRRQQLKDKQGNNKIGKEWRELGYSRLAKALKAVKAPVGVFKKLELAYVAKGHSRQQALDAFAALRRW